MKPFLFGTIGASIKFSELEYNVIPYAILIVTCGLIIRCIVTYICVWNKKFNVGERLLFVIAWTPKATVQAVLGDMVLDWAKKQIDDDDPVKDEYISHGYKILTTAIISIFMTAPLGAILTENLGKKWLHKTELDDKEANPGVTTNKPNAIAPDSSNLSGKSAPASSSKASKSSKESSKSSGSNSDGISDNDKSNRQDTIMPLALPDIYRDVLNHEGKPKFEPGEIDSNISELASPYDQPLDQELPDRQISARKA